MKLLRLLLLTGALSSLVLAGGCRKKTETDVKLATKPLHCYNGELDADELTVDSGGSCGFSGLTMASDCGMATNTAKITSDIPTTTNYTVTACTKTVSGSFNTYTLTLNGGRYIHVTTTTDVQLNTDLDMAGTPTAPDECAVDYYMSSFSGSCSDGQVRIKYDGVHYAVNICAATWYSGFDYGDLSAYAPVN